MISLCMGGVERWYWRHKDESRILKNITAQFISVTLKYMCLVLPVVQ